MIVSLNQLAILILIFARISGVFLEAPVFNSRSILRPVKVFLAVWISIVLWFVVPIKAVPQTLTEFAVMLVVQLAIGFCLGFIANFIFLAVQAAGEIMDLQMGLSVGATLDPIFGSSISVVGRLTFYAALTIFLIFNGHHMVLSALNQSFRLVPIGYLPNFANPKIFFQLLELMKFFWLTALSLAAPAVVLIFISDFTFGIVSRVAPQVNVFMLGFQVKPTLGLVALLFALPLFIKQITFLVEAIGRESILFLSFIK